MKLTILFILIFAFTTPIFAARGQVVYKRSSCDYFIVYTPKTNSYALLEWYGGHEPGKDDIIVGDYESYGFKDVFCLTDDEEMRVYVEDYLLSRSSVIEEYFERCEE
jgi:hypothetical protein